MEEWNNINSRYYLHSLCLRSRHCSQQPYEIDDINIFILQGLYGMKKQATYNPNNSHMQICFDSSFFLLTVFCKIKVYCSTSNLNHINWITGRVSEMLTKDCDYNFCQVNVICLQNDTFSYWRPIIICL